MLWPWHWTGKGLLSAKSRTLYVEKHVTYCAGGWVDPRTSLDGCGEEKILPQPRLEPLTVQAVETHNAISPLRPRLDCRI